MYVVATACLADEATENSLPANYNFAYSVNDPQTGDVKDQQETREGDAVNGYYRTLDSDGFVRTVTYKSDAVNGFTAEVVRAAADPSAVPAVPAVKAVKVAAPVPVVAPVAVKAPVKPIVQAAAPVSYSPYVAAPYYGPSTAYPYYQQPSYGYQPYSYGYKYQPYSYGYSAPYPYSSYASYPYASYPFAGQYASPIASSV